MAVTNTPIITPKTAETAQTVQYSSPAATRTTITKFTASNTTGAPITLAVNLVPATGTAGASNLVVPAKAVQSGGVYSFPELVGQVLAGGAAISTIASAAGLTISAAGAQET
jgi:hypothetical protein